MTARQVAFLRAINVGGHTVTMADLRRHLGAIGLVDVETFIASGNVVFNSDEPRADLERQIETGLRAALGYDVATFVRTDREVARIANVDRVAGTVPRPGETIFVGFLREPLPAPARAALTELSTEDDLLEARGRELFWLRRGSMRDSPISGALIEKTLGRVANDGRTTLRNANTLRRLAEKYPVGSAREP